MVCVTYKETESRPQARSYHVAGVSLSQEVDDGRGDDGVHADEEVDAHVADEGHLCVFEHG